MQQSNTATASSGGSFWGSIGGALTDFASDYGQAYLDDKYSESSSEQSEGLTEFANPNTVTQPVYQSTLPGGQSLNLAYYANRLGIPVAALVALLVGAAYFLFVRK